MSHLPIQLDSLLHARTVESNRIEFKGTWDEYIKESAVKTICAFANDLYNMGGGYIVLGVESNDEGLAVLPPRGLDGLDIDRIQLEVTGACRAIEPSYLPLMFVEHCDGRTILVLWVPAGNNPPYEAPRGKKSGKARYVRSGSTTLEAKGELETQLIQKSARVPFDDQPNYKAQIKQISPTLVRQYLENVKSGLSDDDLRDEEIYEKLGLLWRVNGHSVPRNVALLFFSFKPEEFFRGAMIELARYSFEGDLLDEQTIKGPLDHQLRLAMNAVQSMIGTLRKKIDGQAEVQLSVEYPIEAVEEALANAIYHRSYESMDVEPTKILIYADRIEIISYPGPVPGLQIGHLAADSTLPPPPARNRRIGDFLKELRMAERRGTGLSKIRRMMARNGSPDPRFDFDESRTYFRTTLPVHADYRVRNQLEPVIGAWLSGDRQRALDALREQFRREPSNGAITQQLLTYLFQFEAVEEAEATFSAHASAIYPFPLLPDVLFLYAEEMTKRGRNRLASEALRLVDAKAFPKAAFRVVRMLLGSLEEFEAALKILLQLQETAATYPTFIYLLAVAKLNLGRKSDAPNGTLLPDVVRLSHVLRVAATNPWMKSASWLLEAAAKPEVDNSSVAEALRIHPTIFNEDDGLIGFWASKFKPN